MIYSESSIKGKGGMSKVGLHRNINLPESAPFLISLAKFKMSKSSSTCYNTDICINNQYELRERERSKNFGNCEWKFHKIGIFYFTLVAILWAVVISDLQRYLVVFYSTFRPNQWRVIFVYYEIEFNKQYGHVCTGHFHSPFFVEE